MTECVSDVVIELCDMRYMADARLLNVRENHYNRTLVENSITLYIIEHVHKYLAM